jgi:hypothetical protein
MPLEKIEMRGKLVLCQVKAQIADRLNARRHDVVVHEYDAPVSVKKIISKARQAADDGRSLNCVL